MGSVGLLGPGCSPHEMAGSVKNTPPTVNSHHLQCQQAVAGMLPHVCARRACSKPPPPTQPSAPAYLSLKRVACHVLPQANS